MFKKITSLITALLLSTTVFSSFAFAETTYQRSEKLLVVLVEFTETEETLKQYPNYVFGDGSDKYDGSIKKPDSYYSDRFFGTNGYTVRNYFREVSCGKLDYLPAEENGGTANDGIVRVKLPIPHPNDYITEGEASGILTDAAKSLILQNVYAQNGPLDNCVDFSKFDTDQTNGLDFIKGPNELNIVFVLASNVYGPHTREFYNRFTPTCSFDNKSLAEGIVFANADGTNTLSAICHEICHVNGAVDLYNMPATNISFESIMSTGCLYAYIPPHLDPYHKIALGFVDPIIVNSPGTYTVNSIDLSDPRKYNVLKIPIKSNYGEEEYFLVENRQPVGFDIGLFDPNTNSGIGIWHVKMTNSTLSYIQLEIADTDHLLPDGNVSRNAFYSNGGTGRNTFGPETTPSNSRASNGMNSLITITVNSPSSSSMSVTVDMFVPPSNFKAVAHETNTVLTWDPVVGAVEYEISIDKAPFFSVGSGTSYTSSLSGKHSYKVRAKNSSGSTAESKELDAIHILYGDVNRDGTITIEDLNALKNFLLNPSALEPGTFLTDSQKIAADVDGNENVDAIDLSVITAFTQGTISQFPAGKAKLITYGDVNGDGFVTQEDYTMVNNNLDSSSGEMKLTSLGQRIAAEVTGGAEIGGYYNGCSKISIGDALCIRDYLSGKQQSFWVMTDQNYK
ncbi:MAG TPA: dockerin type I domain-containing protein [Clostridia bacterium]